MKFLPSALLLSALLAAAAPVALANGRPPATIDVKPRSGTTELMAGTTFGVTFSDDEGGAWRWVCEDPLGYAGTFDPDYEWSPTGKLFTTSFVGLRVSSSDKCTYPLLPSLMLPDQTPRYIAAITFGPDGAFYAAASDDDDGTGPAKRGSRIYRSTDEGVTFPQVTEAFDAYEAWRSIEVAPSNARRVYLAGIRVQANVPRVFLLYRSNDAAATFTPMSTTGITGLVPVSLQDINIVGISPTDPDVLYLRVSLDGDTDDDAIYRSADGGATWTKVLSKTDSLRAFVVRRNGDIIVGTPTLGAFKSTDGVTFEPMVATPPAKIPQLSCLSERADGMLFGCTQNYGVGGDGAGVMKSSDGLTWTSALRYEDVQAPVSCAAGTEQKDTCEATEWCGIKEQLSIASTVIDCPAVLPDGGMPDGGNGGGSNGGCCETGAESPSLLLCGLTALVLAWRKRRPAAKA